MIAGSKPLLIAVCAAGLLAGHPALRMRAAEPTAQELAQSLQKRIDGIKDFTADFVHTYEGGVLRKQVVERGRLVVKKPGKMRWEYTAPEAKTFVSDGLKIYSYIPADKQVVVSPVPPDDEASTPALFLAGKGSLTRDFTASLAAPPANAVGGVAAGAKALKLVPKVHQQDYDEMILVVDGSTLAFRGLVTTDAQGGKSSFSFTNLKENTGLTDKDFAFKIPRGVDVVSTSTRR